MCQSVLDGATKLDGLNDRGILLGIVSGAEEVQADTWQITWMC